MKRSVPAWTEVRDIPSRPSARVRVATGTAGQRPGLLFRKGRRASTARTSAQPGWNRLLVPDALDAVPALVHGCHVGTFRELEASGCEGHPDANTGHCLIGLEMLDEIGAPDRALQIELSLELGGSAGLRPGALQSTPRE